MSDMIDDNRFVLIEKYKQRLIESTNIESSHEEMEVLDSILFRFWQMGWLDKLEKPEPQEIGYDDCANALLKMWMDNVLTDGEYYRIADKLNEKWGKKELPEPYKGVTE